MIIGLVCFIVASLFFVNLMYSLGKNEQRENGWLNLILGGLLLLIIVSGFLKEWTGPTSSEHPLPALWWAAQSLMFAMTYILLGMQRIMDFDGRVVGWWSLFVVINVPLPVYQCFASGDIRFGLIWTFWGWLWLLFFISMGLQKGAESKLFNRISIISTVIGYIFTLQVPALLILNGWW